MTGFVIAAAALVLAVLGYVLRPLWRPRPALGGVLVLSLACVVGLLYVLIGTPQALDPAQRKAPENLGDAIVQLERQLQRDPNQIEGWRLLANAYTAEGEPGKARDAIDRALRLAPDDADLLVQSAEARAMAAPERRFDASGVAMLQRALAAQPSHQRARWFLGIAHRQANRPADAARMWEPLLAQVEPATAATLRAQIDAARTEAGLPPLPAPSSQPAQASGRRLTVRVALAPELAARLPANATLFVIARQPGGPPMPVAAEKVPAASFPIEVVLDDADSPMPTLKLSQLDRVEVIARLSATGDATPAAGDLEATARPAGKDTASVDLLIDHARP